MAGTAIYLDTDIALIYAWGAEIGVTPIEDRELLLLDVMTPPDVVVRHGMKWVHLPIRDVLSNGERSGPGSASNRYFHADSRHGSGRSVRGAVAQRRYGTALRAVPRRVGSRPDRGAVWGRSAIPPKWLDRLAWRE